MSHPADASNALDRLIEHAAQDLGEEARRTVNDHPEPEELVAYQEGRLGEHIAARVRRHLVDCTDCAQEVLQLAAFDREPPPDLLPSAAETAADWAALQRLVEGEKRGPGTDDVTRPAAGGAAPVRAPRRASVPWLLAASILFAVTGLSFWLAGLGQRAARPVPGPAASAGNPILVALLPDGEDRRRGATGAREIEMPAAFDVLILRLNLGDQTPFPAYRAELFDAAGVKVWSRPQLQRQPAGHFLVVIDRAFLEAGRNRLQLVGVRDGEERPLATYTFELREPPGE